MGKRMLWAPSVEASGEDRAWEGAAEGVDATLVCGGGGWVKQPHCPRNILQPCRVASSFRIMTAHCQTWTGVS